MQISLPSSISLPGLALLALLGLLSGCSTTPTQQTGSIARPMEPVAPERPAQDGPPAEQRDVSLIPDAEPREEPLARYGNRNPYEVLGRSYRVLPTAKGYVERGTASWYGVKFHGQTTSTRDIYDVWGMTAAHRSLPLPTYAKVTNLNNGQSVVVKINDRGPFHSDRLIDLSYAAAKKLGFAEGGTGNVEVRAIAFGDGPSLPEMLAEAAAQNKASAKAEKKQAKGQEKNPKKGAEKDGDKGKEKSTATATAKGKAKPEQKGPTFIQVASFSKKNEAEQLQKKLKGSSLKQQVRVLTPEKKGEDYRVQVGPLKDPSHKDQVNRTLAQLGLRGAKVVVD